MGVKLIDNKAKVVQALREQIAIRLNQAAGFMASEAINSAPVDTGFLKAHIGQTITATPGRLEAEVRSLARYSAPTDTGIRGTLWWTRAWLRTREVFPKLLIGKTQVGTVGGNIIKAAEMDFHGPLGRKGGGF